MNGSAMATVVGTRTSARRTRRPSGVTPPGRLAVGRIVCAASAALIVLVALPACSFLSPEKDAARWAVLASVDELPGAAATAPAEPASPPVPTSTVRYGLGPIQLPDYVLHAEIVTRHDGTRIVPSATERWSEPFDRGVERVLAIDLERALGTGRIVHYPWYQTDRPDVQIQIAFTRCEREDKGKVVVAAHWTVRTLGEGGGVIERESRIEHTVSGSEGASTALALSQALADLAAEIAQAQSSPAHATQGQAAESAKSR